MTTVVTWPSNILGWLADRLRPRWLVWENVPGVLSSNGGRDFGSILGGMGELGYGVAYRVLDAQFFGVAQRRRRVFVVGYLGDWRRAAAVLFERHSLSGNPAPRRQSRKDLAPTISARPSGGGGLGTDFDLDGGLIADETIGLMERGRDGALNLEYRSDGTANAILTPNGGRGGLGVGAVAYPINPNALRGDTTAKTPSLDAAGVMRLRDPGLGVGADGDPADTLQAAGPGAVAYAIQERAVCENPAAGPDGAGFRADDAAYTLEARAVPQAVAFAVRTNQTGQNGPGYMEGISPALSSDESPSAVAFTCSEHANSFAWERPFAPTISAQVPNDTSNIQTGVRIGSAVRRLTPRECERLQGFPDDYTMIPYGAKAKAEFKEELAAYFERTGQYLRECGPDQWEFDRAAFEAAWPRIAADGPRYKALGNSMAVPVMRWIGERIQAVEALTSTEAANETTDQNRAA